MICSLRTQTPPRNKEKAGEGRQALGTLSFTFLSPWYAYSLFLYMIIINCTNVYLQMNIMPPQCPLARKKCVPSR